MINAKYGSIPNETMDVYREKLVGRIYKILPMKEEDCETWDAYIESLLFELIGHGKLMDNLENSSEFISLLSILKSLIGEKDIVVVRREVFKCLSLVKRI